MLKYTKLFETVSEYEEYVVSSDYVTPNTVLIEELEEEDNGGVVFNHYVHDYSKDYLTFVALESGTFKLTIGSAVSTNILTSISYSLDGGETWTTTNNQDSTKVVIETPTVNQGDKVLWKGNGVGVSTTTNNSNRPSTSSIFSSSGRFNVEGNILSLVWGDDFGDKYYVAEGSSYNFALLFYANTSHVGNDYARVVSAKNLSLKIRNVPTCCFFRMFQEKANVLGVNNLVEAPSIISSESVGVSACTSMFYGCTSLMTAPSVLLATTLANYCYTSMFEGCTSLTTATQLPATTLASSCYSTMFGNCSGLTTAHEVLPATILADYCYDGMFSGCTSLVTAPQLPATTLAERCYYNMFVNCRSLTTVPEVLPATKMAKSCCTSMFWGCTSLTTAPKLPATTLAENCYQNMFHGCTSLTTAPQLPATTLADFCYSYMFSGCTNLSSITCLATNISAHDCTYNWVNGVSASGTFTKAASMSGWGSGNSGIPSGWVVVDNT